MTHAALLVEILDHIDTGIDHLDGAECVDEIDRAEDVAEARELFRDIQAELEEAFDAGV